MKVLYFSLLQVQNIGINCTCDSAASETRQKPVIVKRGFDLAGMNNSVYTSFSFYQATPTQIRDFIRDMFSLVSQTGVKLVTNQRCCV